MNFRDAKLADEESIVELVNSVYGGKSERQWTSEKDIVGGSRLDGPSFREILSQKSNIILVAEETEKGLLLGCVRLEKLQEACYLGMLSIRATHQQYGFGSKLLHFAEDYAKTQFKAREMVMHVISVREELITWYKKRGYALSGEQLEYSKNSSSTNWEKASPLYFEVLRKPLLN